MVNRVVMIKKTLVILAVVLLLSVISIAAYANNNGTEQVKWSIAGPIFRDSDYALLNLTAKGSPGPAQITASGAASQVDVDDQCTGAFLQLKFVDGSFVAVFPDQSMLFFVIDVSEGARNANCYYAGKPSEGTFEYNIVGGTGRYEGASGHVLVTTIAWKLTSVMSAETGSITGVIEQP